MDKKLTSDTLLLVFKNAIKLGLILKYLPDDDGDGYTLIVGDVAFYSAEEALAFFNDSLEEDFDELH